MAKKDFSKVNNNPLYTMQQEATEPLPGQVYLEGTAPEDAPEQLTPEAEQALYNSQLRGATVSNPQNAPAGVLSDFPQMRRNHPRKNAGMQRFFTYIKTDNLEYINTMSGLLGITRQEFLNGIIAEAMANDAQYKIALELKKQVQNKQKGN